MEKIKDLTASPLKIEDWTLVDLGLQNEASGSDLIRASEALGRIREAMGALLSAVEKSQAALLTWIVPDSLMGDSQALSELLGVLDHKDLVTLVNAARKAQP